MLAVGGVQGFANSGGYFINSLPFHKRVSMAKETSNLVWLLLCFKGWKNSIFIVELNLTWCYDILLLFMNIISLFLVLLLICSSYSFLWGGYGWGWGSGYGGYRRGGVIISNTRRGSSIVVYWLIYHQIKIIDYLSSYFHFGILRNQAQLYVIFFFQLLYFVLANFCLSKKPTRLNS